MALGLSKQELVTCFTTSDRGMTYDDFRSCIDGKSTGAVRISVGIEAAEDLVADVRDFARGVPFHDDRTLVIVRRS